MEWFFAIVLGFFVIKWAIGKEKEEKQNIDEELISVIIPTINREE